MRSTSVVTVSLLLMGGVLAGPAFAEKDLLKLAKEAGFPATSCQYCHASKLPKKDTFKREELNERGKWLAAEKDKQKAKTVSVDWLKGYPGSKEQ